MYRRGDVPPTDGRRGQTGQTGPVVAAWPPCLGRMARRVMVHCTMTNAAPHLRPVAVQQRRVVAAGPCGGAGLAGGEAQGGGATRDTPRPAVGSRPAAPAYGYIGVYILYCNYPQITTFRRFAISSSFFSASPVSS